MSWQVFKDNMVSFYDNPENISDIDKVAKKWADEYDAAIKRGGDTINKIKIQNGNKAPMEQLFKSALQKGLSSTAPYDLVGEMGNGVIAYWSGAIMQNVPIPLQLPPGATANVSVTSNVVLNPGQWIKPIPGTELHTFNDEPDEFSIANDIDMPSAENAASDSPITEEEVQLEAQNFGDNLQEEFDAGGFAPLPTATLELIQNPEVIDYDAGLPLPGTIDITQLPEPTFSQNQTQVESEFKAVLVGGLDNRSGDLKIDQQEELFKQGFGNVKIKSFVYGATVANITTFLSENPKLPVFLFSKGCERAESLSKSNLVDNNNLFIIEPWVESANSKKIIDNAIKNGVPASNVYVGPGAARGTGIVGASKTPSGIDHWGALKYVGSQKASLASQKFYKPPTKESNGGGGEPQIYTNVGATADNGAPPGFEKYVTDRSKTRRKGASKADGPNGGIPYEAMRKIVRPAYIEGTVYLHPEAAATFELFLDFLTENAIDVEFTPGGGFYRDYENQERLWNTMEAGRAATPGHSNHGWGIAIDVRTLCIQTEGAASKLGVSATQPKPNQIVRAMALYKFFAAHAPKFGWYNPSSLCDGNKPDETWHWEYKGFSTLSGETRKALLKQFAETPRKNPQYTIAQKRNMAKKK
jgi:hypothetical protein